MAKTPRIVEKKHSEFDSDLVVMGGYHRILHQWPVHSGSPQFEIPPLLPELSGGSI